MSHSSKAITKISHWANEMVQQVNVFAAQPNKMKSIPGSYMIEVSVCGGGCYMCLDLRVAVRR